MRRKNVLKIAVMMAVASTFSVGVFAAPSSGGIRPASGGNNSKTEGERKDELGREEGRGEKGIAAPAAAALKAAKAVSDPAKLVTAIGELSSAVPSANGINLNSILNTLEVVDQAGFSRRQAEAQQNNEPATPALTALSAAKGLLELSRKGPEGKSIVDSLMIVFSKGIPSGTEAERVIIGILREKESILSDLSALTELKTALEEVVIILSKDTTSNVGEAFKKVFTKERIAKIFRCRWS